MTELVEVMRRRFPEGPPAPRRPVVDVLAERVTRVETPADPTSAARAQKALTRLDAIASHARELADAYRSAPTNSERQAAALDQFDEVLAALADLAEVLASTVRAVVRHTD
jgi:hypothetical protein